MDVSQISAGDILVAIDNEGVFIKKMDCDKESHQAKKFLSLITCTIGCLKLAGRVPLTATS